MFERGRGDLEMEVPDHMSVLFTFTSIKLKFKTNLHSLVPGRGPLLSPKEGFLANIGSP